MLYIIIHYDDKLCKTWITENNLGQKRYPHPASIVPLQNLMILPRRVFLKFRVYEYFLNEIETRPT